MRIRTRAITDRREPAIGTRWDPLMAAARNSHPAFRHCASSARTAQEFVGLRSDKLLMQNRLQENGRKRQ